MPNIPVEHRNAKGVRARDYYEQSANADMLKAFGTKNHFGIVSDYVAFFFQLFVPSCNIG